MDIDLAKNLVQVHGVYEYWKVVENYRGSGFVRWPKLAEVPAVVTNRYRV